MQQPLIIWTMRRTGGTALASALEEFYARKTKHEPFNLGAPFGHIMDEFNNGAKFSELQGDVVAAIESVDVLKHCFDLHPRRLHGQILKATTARDWKHLFLYRRDAESRAISLELARQTGLWGKKDLDSQQLIAALKSGEKALPPFDVDRVCASVKMHHGRTRWLRNRMVNLGIHHYELAFEDIYSAGSVDDWGQPLAQYLAMDDDQYDILRTRMMHVVSKGGQGTSSLYKQVPNIATVREALASLQVSAPRQSLYHRIRRALRR